MIVFLVGDNSFAVHQELRRLQADFSGDVEKIDGASLELNQLPDLLSGTTLFSDKRLVIISELSANSKVWSAMADFLPNVSDDVTLVIVEEKPDKRTKTYKQLSKLAKLQEIPAWSDRDTRTAEKWVVDQSKSQGLSLSPSLARTLVERAGLDQWRLFHIIEQLSLLEDVDQQAIERLVPALPHESVFSLLDATLRHDTKRVSAMIDEFSLTQDPHQLFGLISTQLFQLAALKVSEVDSKVVASDIGAHPYALSKLAPRAKQISRPELRRLIERLAKADIQMKSIAADPWVIVRRALME